MNAEERTPEAPQAAVSDRAHGAAPDVVADPVEPQSSPAPAAQSGARTADYRFVESLHLRQWVLRAVLPLSVLATNGAGLLDVSWLPRHDVIAGTLADGPAVTTAVQISGAALIAVSAWVRVLSKGVLVRKRMLTTGGVYRRVRHPFYLANLVGAAGTLLLAGSLGAAVLIPWLLMAIPVYVITIRGEEDGLGTLFPDAWDAYARAVPSLIPVPGRRGPPPATPTRVTWAGLVAEREPPRLLRFLGGAALVLSFASGGSLASAFAVAGVSLFALSYVIPHVIGGRRG